MSPGDRERRPERRPERRGVRPGGRRSLRQELADSTEHGEVYLRVLRRAQLQLSVLALVAFGAVFGILPVVLDLLPSLRHTTVIGVPIAIWVVIVPLSPLFITIGWLYARRADALDAAFRELVDK